MNTTTINRLSQIIDTVPDLLIAIPEKEFSFKPDENKWSKKEILGHLIDSATNNHHRFVRAQFEDSLTISYNQDLWVRSGHYQNFDSEQLIEFWKLYNMQLLELVRQIPEEQHQLTCNVGDGEIKTLEKLFDDYLTHLEHHLQQLISY